jgi:hypothetical protein
VAPLTIDQGAVAVEGERGRVSGIRKGHAGWPQCSRRAAAVISANPLAIRRVSVHAVGAYYGCRRT